MPAKVFQGLSFDIDEDMADLAGMFVTMNVMSVGLLQEKGSLQREVTAAYQSETFEHDVSLVCDLQEIRCSRTLLTARSPVFAKLLKGKTRAVLNVSGITPSVLREVVDYVHTDNCGTLEDLRAPVHSLLQLFGAAGRLRVQVGWMKIVMRCHS